MNISTRWLREWVSPDVSDIELSEKLTMAGLEVDQIAPVAPPFEGLVVGHVVGCGKHPNADKLSLCEVDIGTGESINLKEVAAKLMPYRSPEIRAENPTTERVKTCADIKELTELGWTPKHRVII